MKMPITILATAILGLSFLSIGFADDDQALLKDHIMMTDGKVIMIKEGKACLWIRKLRFSDGTKVTGDGAVTMTDAGRLFDEVRQNDWN